LSFLADDDDCQTEEDTLTNAGVEEAASFPEPIMHVYTRRAAAVTTPARFQQSPSKELLLLVFFPCEKTTSYIEDTQKRFREEIHLTETKAPVPRFLSCLFHYKTHAKVTQMAINRCTNEITNHNSSSNQPRSKHKHTQRTHTTAIEKKETKKRQLLTYNTKIS
jgi:hypothetical protein